MRRGAVRDERFLARGGKFAGHGRYPAPVLSARGPRPPPRPTRRHALRTGCANLLDVFNPTEVQVRVSADHYLQEFRAWRADVGAATAWGSYRAAPNHQ